MQQDLSSAPPDSTLPEGMRGDGVSSTAIRRPSPPGRSRSSGRRSSFGSSGRGTAYESDLMTFSDKDTPSAFVDIGNQVSSMSQRLAEMEESATIGRDECVRLRTENARLNERLNLLDEMLGTNELRFEQQLEEERARRKEVVKQVERERDLQLESVLLKYELLQKDVDLLRADKERLQQDLKAAGVVQDRLREEADEANDRAERAEQRRDKIADEFRAFREEAQLDLDSSSELVEHLTRETDELRRRHGQSHVSQVAQLEFDLMEARRTANSLREERDELKQQLLASSVVAGRELLAESETMPSLADQLVGHDQNELLTALRDQDVCNQQLKHYINGILSRVIERHPEILEIKELGGAQNGAAAATKNQNGIS